MTTDIPAGGPAVIDLSPPVNYIRRIEQISPTRWQLTLINNGSFTIDIRDAARYGVNSILNAYTGR